MPTYRDDAIVLRTHLLGESDKIVTLLGRSRGKIRAVAKGIRKTTSRFGARLEPFNQVDAMFYEGKSLDIIQQAESLGSHSQAIGKDYGKYTCAMVMVEMPSCRPFRTMKLCMPCSRPLATSLTK